jgi:hypothetical protein
MSRLAHLVLAGLALAFASPAVAQPAGSYLATCTQVGQRGPTLFAVCQTRQGFFVQSQLDLRGCVGDISNQNGQLFCRRGGFQGGPQFGFEPEPRPRQVIRRGLPPGSWQFTCGEPTLQGPVLSATCQTARGNFRRTSIDLRQCEGGPVENANGRLVCEY